MQRTLVVTKASEETLVTVGQIIKGEPENHGDFIVLQTLSGPVRDADVYYEFLPLLVFRPATQQDFDRFRIHSHPDYFQEL